MKTTKIRETSVGRVDNLAVVIPAYNEEKNIEPLIKQILTSSHALKCVCPLNYKAS